MRNFIMFWGLLWSLIYNEKLTQYQRLTIFLSGRISEFLPNSANYKIIIGQ